MAPAPMSPQMASKKTCTCSIKTSERKLEGPTSIHREPYEPLAVIGLAIKFPQEATSVENFWRMLLEKRCAMTEWPGDRINIDAFHHPDPSRRGTIAFRGGHFLKQDPSYFDAPFFSITAAEAEAMDPQHRMLLETTYHALENAGIPLNKMSGLKTSVHAGCFTDDYSKVTLRDPDNLPSHACTGLASSMLSNRISWFFNLTGPSMSLDTACSSSMMAVDLACQGLHSRDTDTAIVAGASLALGLDLSMSLSRMGFLSKDSKCFSFDSRANGYGRGEGFGVLIIKRLSDALLANDTIRAVIRATGSNQDGRTPGITQPSQAAQENLIRETYRKAALDMSVTRFVEAHGTGTLIGDPIEANAIGNAFREHRTAAEPMYIGAAKSNIGHLEGTSGVAGIIKAIMLLEKGLIAPNTNFEVPNPNIDTDQLRIKFPTESIPWPSRGLRRVSVSSFGFGGSNTHVVLDDAYNFLRLRGLQGRHWTIPEPSLECDVEDYHKSSVSSFAARIKQRRYGEPNSFADAKLLVWSAADQGSLSRLTTAYEVLLRERDSSDQEELEPFLQSLAFTLSDRRSHLNWRSFAVLTPSSDLCGLAKSFSKPVRAATMPKLGYVFTGQGAQYAGMAKDLTRFPVFRASLERSEMYFDQAGSSWSLQTELQRPEDSSRINQAEYSQPLCTAVQLALVDLIHSLNLEPSVVLGHSSGEIAAAYTAGALSQRSACRVAFFRGLCASELAASGSVSGTMMSVGLSSEEAQSYIALLGAEHRTTDVVVACINSPTNVTVSGSTDQIRYLESLLNANRIFTRVLQVSMAYHSPHMKHIASRYQSLLGTLEAGDQNQRPRIVSSVTGCEIDLDELQSGEYWVRNLVSPVRFSDAMMQACCSRKSGVKSFKTSTSPLVNGILEIGPTSALRRPVQDTLKSLNADGVAYISALDRSTSAELALMKAAGILHCLGFPIDISRLNQQTMMLGAELMALPNLPEYPFDHSRKYWHESSSSKEGFRLRKSPKHDLLGTPAIGSNPLAARWKNTVRTLDQQWIQDHQVGSSKSTISFNNEELQVNDTIIYPAAGMIVMALEACKQLVEPQRVVSSYIVKDTTFLKALVIAPGAQGIVTELDVRPSKASEDRDTSTWEFRLRMEMNSVWQEVCYGLVQAQYAVAGNDVDSGKEAHLLEEQQLRRIVDAAGRCSTNISQEQFYDYFQALGFGYGPAFQGVQQTSYDGQTTGMAEVDVYKWPEHEFPQPHIIHPATLDTILQTGIIPLSHGISRSMPPIIPSRLGRLWIKGSGIACPSVGNATVCSQGKFTCKRKTDSQCLVSDGKNGAILMCIEAFEGTAISSNNSDTQSVASRDLCYKMLWKPDIDLLDRAGLEQYCETTEPHEIGIEFFSDLVYVILSFISEADNALASIGFEETPPYLQQYIQWMTYELTRFRQGSLQSFSEDSPKWKKLMADCKFREEMCAHLDSTIQGRFFLKVGRNLLSILTGKLNPLEFLFQDDLVSEFYAEVNKQVISYKPLFRYVDLLVHQNPSMRILEIGAGTGASTDHILAALNTGSDANIRFPSCQQYDYTDISSAFFETAKSKYSYCGDKMQYFVLDISRDPLQQGLKAETYDVIVAASVLHATKNLEATMRNARQLLKPGGKLILFEVVHDAIRASFAFGLLHGWWLSEEEERARGPWITSERWNSLLRRTGFSGVDLEIKDFKDEACHEYSILISTAIETPPGRSESNTAHCSLIRNDGMPLVCPATGINRLDNGSSLVPSLSTSEEYSKLPAPVLVISGNSSQMKIAKIIKEEWISRGSVREPQVLSMEAFLASTDHEFIICLEEFDASLLANLDFHSFGRLQRLLTKASRLLWVTNGGENSSDPRRHIIDGLSRTLCTENNKQLIVTLALDSRQDPCKSVDQILRAFKKVATCSADNFEPEYSERDGVLCVGRVIASPTLNQQIQDRVGENRNTVQEFGQCPPLTLTVGVPGLLDTLSFIEDSSVDKPLASQEIEIKVAYTGMNFRDCLTVLGQVDTDFMGCECAGVVSRTGADCRFEPGDRVAGLYVNSYSTYSRGQDKCTVKVPDNLTLAEASGAATIFTTSWYALHDIARIQPGESILIHAGAGGTGQAAIQVAQYLGAKVYATVGSHEKKKFLVESCGIPSENVFYSRNTSFAQGIMRSTGNRGVDVVLNSLSGEQLMASWDCIAPCGRFIEIGKRDIIGRGQLPMWQFRKNCTFSAVDLAVVMVERPEIIQHSFESIIKLLADGTLYLPKPFKVLGISEVEAGFRLLQSGKFFGKMVVELRSDDLIPVNLKKKEAYRFSENFTYLIAGGLGGLGRSIARWMVQRGTKFLILLSRSGPKTEAANEVVQELRLTGAHVETPACDISDAESLSAVLRDCAIRVPPVKGCIQASMVLRDGIFENLEFEDWAAVLRPKVQGSWNLHSLLPKDMDFFITLSSLTAIIGNAGQANYAAGNSYMDGLVRHRLALGEKATTINLGWIEDEGFVAENVALLAFYASNEYMRGVSIREVHALLEHFCDPSRVIQNFDDAQIITGLSTPTQGADESRGTRDVPWARKRTFRHLLANTANGSSNAMTSPANVTYGVAFREAQTAEERAAAVTAGVVQKLSYALSVPTEELDTSKPLHAYGVDSLLAIELRNYFARDFGAEVAIFDIMGASSFEAVSAIVEVKSSIQLKLGE